MTQHSTLSNNFLIRMHHGKEALRAKIISNRGSVVLPASWALWCGLTVVVSTLGYLHTPT
jgi:hypothetical protein